MAYSREDSGDLREGYKGIIREFVKVQATRAKFELIEYKNNILYVSGEVVASRHTGGLMINPSTKGMCGTVSEFVESCCSRNGTTHRYSAKVGSDTMYEETVLDHMCKTHLLVRGILSKDWANRDPAEYRVKRLVRCIWEVSNIIGSISMITGKSVYDDRMLGEYFDIMLRWDISPASSEQELLLLSASRFSPMRVPTPGEKNFADFIAGCISEKIA